MAQVNLYSINMAKIFLQSSYIFLIVLALSIQSAVCMQPAHNFSDKSVADLMMLLQNKDPQIRQCAAIFLGVRYKNPKSVLPDEPVLKPNSPSPELPLPPVVIPSLAKLLESDTNIEVRLCSLAALENLRYTTNTTPILQNNLTNNLTLIRLRASQSLIKISKQYNEPLPDQVIPTLISCLNPKEDPDEIWQAAYTVGNMGASAKAAIPALEQLKTHSSKKVRTYATEALAKVDVKKS